MAQVLHGDAGVNQLSASTDKTQVYGLSGNDTLISDGKSDVLLIGGSGDDSLIMLGGNGTLSGGKGSDTFELNYSTTNGISAVIEDLEPSSDKIIVNFDGNTAPKLSSVKSGDDIIWKDNAGLFNLTLKSVRENDYFDGTIDNAAWEVLRLTNQERENENLSPMTMAQDLTEGASIRAKEITALGASGPLTGHFRPNGEYFSTVFNKKYNSYPGENLDGGARSAQAVVSDWMNSEPHKKNILNEKFLKLGVGYSEDDADRTNKRFYWTQEFADSLRSPETVSAESLLTANMEINAVAKFVPLSENPDTYSNYDFGATVAALGGADKIINNNLNVSISGGADNDTIESNGSNVTINAGTGDDSISLASSAKNNLIQYTAGDGNDTVSGLHSGDTVSISGDEFTPVTVGNDLIVAVGNDSLTLKDVANLSDINISGEKSNLIILTEDDNNYKNELDDATVRGLGGDDTIENKGDNVTVDAGNGDDSIGNYFFTFDVTINAGAGDDYILNNGEYVIINGEDGDDTVTNQEEYATINGGAGNDFIDNINVWGYVEINGGDDNDNIYNDARHVTIDGGNGDDYINHHDILGDGDVSINGGNGDDKFLIDGDLDDDAEATTINGGLGNDSINLISDTNKVLIEFEVGGGSDTVVGFNETDTLSISGGEYIRSTVGNDVVFAVGTDSITLVDAAGLSVVNIIGTGRENKFINLTEENDRYYNTFDGATINAKDGSDDIWNYANSVSIGGNTGSDYVENYGASITIAGGAGNDFIWSDGESATIRGGADNDTVVLSDNAQSNLIVYNVGDGYDTVDGLKATDTLRIGDGTGTYVAPTIDNDIIVHVGTGQIKLWNAASLGADNINIEGIKGESYSTTEIKLSNSNDTYANSLEGASIYAYGGDDTITNSGSNVYMDGQGNNSIINSGNNVTIVVDSGNDSISNTGNNVDIYDIAGDDTIENSGSNATITGGEGIDKISLIGGSQNNRIRYYAGDGNDTVWGFDKTDTISIAGGSYIRSTVGNDVVFAVGTDSILLVNAASLAEEIRVYGTGIDNKFIELTEDDDDFTNLAENLVQNVYGSDRQRIVVNVGASATINGNGGDDTLSNFNPFASISGGAGNDKIRNDGSYGDNEYGGEYSTIDGGADNDTIDNSANFVSISGGDGDDRIDNDGSGREYGQNVTIEGGSGNDYIDNDEGVNILIDGGAGDDTIDNNSDLDDDWNDDENDNSSSYHASIVGGEGNDSIYNRGSNVSIMGGTGDDSITNYGVSATIDGGADNDVIDNSGDDASIVGNTGDDQIILSSYSNNFIQYNLGDGNDTIWGFDEDDTLQIGDGTDTYSTVGSGDDVIINVGTASITLKDYREEPEHNIIGASGSSGGGSGSGGGGGSGSGGGSAGGSGGSGGGNSGGSGGSGSGNSGGSGGSGSSGGSGGSGSGSSNSRGSYTNTISSSTTAQTTTQQTSTTTNQLWGNVDTSNAIFGGGDSDTFTGTNEADTFVSGKNQGSDTFRNISTKDTIYLNDATLSDLVGVKDVNGFIYLNFNTGNTLTIQSSELLSGAIQLADGTAHLAKGLGY